MSAERQAELDAERDDGPPAEWLERTARGFQQVPAYDPDLDLDGIGPPQITEADARARATRLWDQVKHLHDRSER